MFWVEIRKKGSPDINLTIKDTRKNKCLQVPFEYRFQSDKIWEISFSTWKFCEFYSIFLSGAKSFRKIMFICLIQIGIRFNLPIWILIEGAET